MNSISNDLKSKICNIAVARAASLFRAAEEALPPAGYGALADPAVVTERASLASLLRAPMLGKDLSEGKLFEVAVALPLEAPNMSVMRNLKVPVTDSDVNLASANTFARLVGVRPPAPGRYLGTWEIDVVRHNQDTGLFECIDLKRTKLDDNAELAQRTKIEATAIAAVRFFGKMSITETRVVTLRWNECEQAASGEFLSRETIDAHVKAPIRETVEAAFAAFRAEFDRRFELLAERAMACRPAQLPRPQRAERLQPTLEPQAGPLTLKEAWRLAMRARRLS